MAEYRVEDYDEVVAKYNGTFVASTVPEPEPEVVPEEKPKPKRSVRKRATKKVITAADVEETSK